MLMSITKTHREFKPMLAGKGSSRSDRLNILSDQTLDVYKRQVLDTAELIQKIEGEEEVEKMDTLLSLALTGGDYSWI